MGSLICNTTTTTTTTTTNNNKNKSSVHYRLFMYREELRRRKTGDIISVTKSKISLTESLIQENVQNLHDRSDEDLRIICREMSFKNHLKKQVSHYSKLMKFYKCIENKFVKLSPIFSPQHSMKPEVTCRK